MCVCVSLCAHISFCVVIFESNRSPFAPASPLPTTELRMTKPYTLPDGTRITLGRERYRAAELLFDPAMALREEESLQNSILDCELPRAADLFMLLSRWVSLPVSI